MELWDYNGYMEIYWVDSCFWGEKNDNGDQQQACSLTTPGTFGVLLLGNKK